MYGKNSYGLEQYGVDMDPEGQGTEYFIDLAHYAPAFLVEIRELAEAYDTEGYEMGQIQHEIKDMLRQCFIQTATWGLVRWEKAYGITPNLSLTFEQRREIVMARIRGQGTTTKMMIENTAAAFSGGEVQVVEDNPHSHFVVRFIGIKGIPRNMQGFITMLEDIKPAHLSYSFEYTYTVWNNIKAMNWNELGIKAWDEVKVMEGV